VLYVSLFAKDWQKNGYQNTESRDIVHNRSNETQNYICFLQKSAVQGLLFILQIFLY